MSNSKAIVAWGSMMSSARADSYSLCSVKGLAPQHLPDQSLFWLLAAAKSFRSKIYYVSLGKEGFCLPCEQIQGQFVSFTLGETRRVQKPAELGSAASDPAPMLALKDVTKWGLR